jgi:hypothetical protein
MGTFDSWEHVSNIIIGNGWAVDPHDHEAPDNPPAVKVVEYHNRITGTKCWGVVFRGEREADRYERVGTKPAPRVIWQGPTLCASCGTAHPPLCCPEATVMR